MPKFYVVDGIGAGFDGLVVQGEIFDDHPYFISVDRITDNNLIVGDRAASASITPRGLLVARQFLKEIDDPGIREFASDNPFGKMLAETTLFSGQLRIAFAEFENLLSVTVTDINARRTVISQNFLNNIDEVKKTLHECIRSESSGEDLVFKLNELKENEINGQEES